MGELYDNKSVYKRPYIHTDISFYDGSCSHRSYFNVKEFKMNKICILFPTSSESCDFINPDSESIDVVIGGVGLCEIGASTAKLLSERSPRIIILAGIAGAYPQSGLSIGDSVLVGRERATDQGAFRGGDFVSLYAKSYECPNTTYRSIPTVVNGSSVNSAGSSKLSLDGESVESMEGAAFFAVCLAMGTPFLEVRSVSNYTNSERHEWRMDIATRSLAEALYRLIDEIKA